MHITTIMQLRTDVALEALNRLTCQDHKQYLSVTYNLQVGSPLRRLDRVREVEREGQY